MASIVSEQRVSGAFPRTEARLWMAVTLAGVLLACLAALILTPLRALVSEE